MKPSLSSTAVHPPATGVHGGSRIGSIDALRGLVMLLMLVDHTREFFHAGHPVGDPMDLATTPPALFLTRSAAHLCAPVFVLLTGIAAWLYAAGRARAGRTGAEAASGFLFRRGLFLVVLEWTVVNIAWSFDPAPDTYFLQVIWAIGLAMIALAALVHLPRGVLIAVALALMLGHNLLDAVTVRPDESGYVGWSILHQRGYIDLPWGARARTSYPLLPWIGVIALGYAIGPWFARDAAPAGRRIRLVATAAAMLTGFAVLRLVNGYGEPVPWRAGADLLHGVMGFLNLTKYPPSAAFLLLTLGIGLALLAVLERGAGLGPGSGSGRGTAILAVFGSAPLFFYLLHLYLLHAINRIAGLVTGSEGALVGVPDVASLWLIAAAVAVPCWFACRHFAAAKRRSEAWWMRYL